MKLGQRAFEGSGFGVEVLGFGVIELKFLGCWGPSPGLQLLRAGQSAALLQDQPSELQEGCHKSKVPLTSFL